MGAEVVISSRCGSGAAVLPVRRKWLHAQVVGRACNVRGGAGEVWRGDEQSVNFLGRESQWPAPLVTLRRRPNAVEPCIDSRQGSKPRHA